MRRFACLLVSFVTALTLSAQSGLVKIEDITYSSSFEEEAIRSFMRGNVDFFKLLNCVNTQQNEDGFLAIADRLNKEIDRFHASKITRKKPAKKVKAVYTGIQETFLDKYELENDFTAMFSSGEYNCVSATALFALIFDRLQIPYTIKEMPTHVFLVAYPDSQPILVETTDPFGGYFSFSQYFKRTYVEDLKRRNLIGSAEYQEKSISELFDQYYFSDDEISMQELVGIQYLNDGIYKLDKGDFANAFRQFEKGYLFYPGEKAAYLLMTTGLVQLSKLNRDDPEYIELVLKLSRYDQYGITGDRIVDEFNNLTSTILNIKGDLERYKGVYEKFKRELEGKEVMHEIAYIFHYEIGRYRFNKGQITEALENVEKAYNIEPGNAQGESFFVTTIREKSVRFNDSQLTKDFLEEYGLKYKQLSENPLFTSLLLDSYLEYSDFQFKISNPQIGEAYLKKFEQGYRDNTDLNIRRQLIVQAYASAAVYFFVQGNKAKSKAYLQSGLKYVPESLELKQRLQMLR